MLQSQPMATILGQPGVIKAQSVQPTAFQYVVGQPMNAIHGVNNAGSAQILGMSQIGTGLKGIAQPGLLLAANGLQNQVVQHVVPHHIPQIKVAGVLNGSQVVPQTLGYQNVQVAGLQSSAQGRPTGVLNGTFK